MSTLAIVNETLQQNNRELDGVSKTLSAMLEEDIKRRKSEERSRKDREETAREEKKTAKARGKIVEASRRQPKSASGEFLQGLLGDKLFGLASSALAGVFGGISGVSLAKLAGKGVGLGVMALGLQKLAQTAVDNLFESIPPEDLGITDTEQFREDVKKGINTGIAFKFFGASTLGAAGAAVGSAFGDDLANGLESWFGTNIINAPNPLSLFGIGPDSYPVNLENETVQAALGGAVGMIAASLLRIVGKSLVGKLAILSVGAGAALFRKLGMGNIAEILDKYKGNVSSRLDTKGKTPVDPTRGSKAPTGMFDGPAQPKAPDVGKAPTVKLSDATKDILKQVRQGTMQIEGLEFRGQGADARPFIVDDTGKLKLPTNDELNRVTKTATEAVEDASKAVKVAKGAAKVVGEALVPVAIGMDLYAGATDEELKNMGISLSQRTSYAMVESIGFMNDAISNGINMGLNYMLGTDFKTDYNLQGEIRKLNVRSATKVAELQGTSPAAQQTINVNVDNSSNNQNISGSSDKKYMQGTGMSAVDLRYEKKYMSMHGFGLAIGQVH
jgi:hypothetical protein